MGIENHVEMELDLFKGICKIIEVVVVTGSNRVST
jgi:hypothetical protein